MALGLIVVNLLPEQGYFGTVAAMSVSSNPNPNNHAKVYHYFAYGSNLLPSTMENLRGIQPLQATAAVLPGYQLRFDGAASSRWEPSAAFVVPSSTRRTQQQSLITDEAMVHGVLYTLTAKDFAKVGWTEGVPFAYRWQQCTVYPYIGNDDQDVGRHGLQGGTLVPQDAFTLISSKTIQREDKDVPPSSSYLGILQEGARYWKLDASYQTKLRSIPTASNLIVPGGLAGPLLRLAEFQTKFLGKR